MYIVHDAHTLHLVQQVSKHSNNCTHHTTSLSSHCNVMCTTFLVHSSSHGLITYCDNWILNISLEHQWQLEVSQASHTQYSSWAHFNYCHTCNTHLPSQPPPYHNTWSTACTALSLASATTDGCFKGATGSLTPPDSHAWSSWTCWGEALSANFGGRSYTVLTHSSGEFSFHALAISPSISRELGELLMSLIIIFSNGHGHSPEGLGTPAGGIWRDDGFNQRC